MAKRFGIMLDCSRNAMMKIDEMKEYITVLAKMGYNTVEVYTEDTYEVDNEPYFGYLRGRYSKAELREIVDFAKGLGVEMIPCIQTLAHLENIFKWNAYKDINDFANILMVGEDRTYELIENMIKTVRDCYDTDVIHIGMDEAHMLGLGKYLDKHGYRNRFDILNEHLARVIKICEKYNFKPTMWSDMYYRLAHQGEYYDWSNITEEITSKKPDGVDLVYWDYYHSDRNFFRNMLESHGRFSGETWFAGGVWTWMGTAPYTSYSIKSMTEAIIACRECGTDNILMTMWGDNGRECSPWSVLPALFTLRKFYDGIEDTEAIKAEFYDIVGESYDDMMLLELPNVAAGSLREYPSNVSKVMLYSDVLFGFFDVLVPDGVSAEYTAIEKQLREAGARAGKLSYLFDSLADLASVLEIKYDLGVRTRRAYKAGDKAMLEALVPDYEECACRIEKYHASMSYQWHKENKPHGFEILDARFGGLAMRIRAAKNRIAQYLAGEIDSMLELEEELLPYEFTYEKIFAMNGEPGTHGVPSIHSMQYLVSVNNIF